MYNIWAYETAEDSEFDNTVLWDSAETQELAEGVADAAVENHHLYKAWVEPDIDQD